MTDIKQLRAPGASLGTAMVAGSDDGIGIAASDSPASSPGAGSNSQAWGIGAQARGNNTTVIGNGATSGEGQNTTVIGDNAIATQNSRVDVVNYTLGTGDTITLTQPGAVVTVLTEGVDFDAVTDNDTTAENIRVEINAISGLTATRENARVRIYGDLTALETGDVTAWTRFLGFKPQGCLVIGRNAHVESQFCTAIGNNSETLLGTNSVAIGASSHCHNGGAVAVGVNARAGDRSTAVGLGAESLGLWGVAVGLSAQSLGQGVAIGRASIVTSSGVAIGVSASAVFFGTAIGNSAACNNDAIALGRGAQALFNDSIALGGRDATTTAPNQFVVGATGSQINDVYIGRGVDTTNTSLGTLSFNSTSQEDAVNTDEGGTSLSFRSGKGTGLGTPSTIDWQTPAVGVTGTAQQSLVTRLLIGTDGTVSAPGAGTNSEQWGAGAEARRNNTVVIGQGATAGEGFDSVVIGKGAIATESNKVTVVNYLNGALDTITLTQPDAVVTILTEGTDFDAVTDEDTTAENIRVAIDAITGLTATRIGAIVTFVGDLTASATSDATAWTVHQIFLPTDSVIIGKDARTESNRCVVVGKGAKAVGGPAGSQHSTVIGWLAQATDKEVTVIGSQASGGLQGVAIGNNSAAGLLRGVAIGKSAMNSGNNGTSVGYGTSTTAAGIAIGSNADSTGEGLAIGIGSCAGHRAIAIGTIANSAFQGSIAFGDGATTTGQRAIALGRFAVAAARQFVVGSTNNHLTDAYFGRGFETTNTNVGTFSINASSQADGNNTDEAGTALVVRSGKGTGAAVGTAMTFQTPTAIATGTDQQSWVTRLILSETVIDVGSADAEAIRIGLSSSATLGFLGTAAVAQQADTVALTDNSGGTADSTIAVITNIANAGSADVGPTADAIADLAAKYNSLRTLLQNYGLMA